MQKMRFRGVPLQLSHWLHPDGAKGDSDVQKQGQANLTNEVSEQRERISETARLMTAKEEQMGGLYASSWSQLRQELFQGKQDHSQDKEAEVSAMRHEWQERIMKLQAQHHKEIKLLIHELKLRHKAFIKKGLPWREPVRSSGKQWRIQKDEFAALKVRFGNSADDGCGGGRTTKSKLLRRRSI